MTDTNATAAPPVRTELRDGGVLLVTLSRSGKRNCLDAESFALLGEAFGSRAHGDDVRCVVLRGEGPAFCSGLDRTLLASLASPGAGLGDIAIAGRRLQEVLDQMEACPRVTLAAVQGACIGGGLALMLACDLRIAERSAFFSMMEMRYGFVPDLGHVHRFQREVGPARAKEVILFGDRVDADSLGSWGVVNEVVDDGTLVVATERWAARMAALPPLAMRAAKAIMLADPGGQDGAASQRDALRANVTLLRSADFREGLNAAMERRPPQFTGA